MIGVNLKCLAREQMNGHRTTREGVQHNDVISFVLWQLRHAKPGITQQNILFFRFARFQIVKPFLRKTHGSRIDFIKIVGIALTCIVGQGASAQANKRYRKIGFLRYGPQKRIANTAVTRVISCLLYTSPSPRDRQKSRMPSSA